MSSFDPKSATKLGRRHQGNFGLQRFEESNRLKYCELSLKRVGLEQLKLEFCVERLILQRALSQLNPTACKESPKERLARIAKV